jgi:hypothetical protein
MRLLLAVVFVAACSTVPESTIASHPAKGSGGTSVEAIATDAGQEAGEAGGSADAMADVRADVKASGGRSATGGRSGGGGRSSAGGAEAGGTEEVGGAMPASGGSVSSGGSSAGETSTGLGGARGIPFAACVRRKDKDTLCFASGPSAWVCPKPFDNATDGSSCTYGEELPGGDTLFCCE